MPDTAIQARLRAGACLIDLEREMMLDERGEPLPLRPRAWQVLRHLAERPGRLVTKDELIAAVWPEGAITDNSLVQAVVDIRRALGPSAARALRTVPRRGYLLMVDAGETDDAMGCPPAAGRAGTAAGGASPPTLGDVLRAQAARRFVGREAELATLRPAMGREMPAQALFFVHGPGGIGKSTLLERLRLMAEPGVDIVCVNGAELMPTPQGVIDGMAAALGLGERSASPEAIVTAWAARGRSVLLLDTFEALDPVAGWMRDSWLPTLPAQVSVVLAGRRAPDSRWSAHALWASAMHAVALDMLAPPACARLAQAHGAPEALCAELARRARGLPLAAVMLATEARRTGSLPGELGEELVRALTRPCLEQAPSAAHREALLACALARRATRELLGHLFGAERADTLFDWLAAQGYISASRDGLGLHDLMREALLADTAWCDRDRFRQLRRTVIRHLAARLRPGRHAWDLTLDFFYARRHSPGFRRYHDVEGVSRVGTSIGTADDFPEVIAFARRLLPEGEHPAFLHWSAHPAADIVVVREEQGPVCGVMVMLRLSTIDDDAGDPVTSGLRAALGRQWDEPTDRTYSLFVRYFLASGDASAPTPGLTALMAYSNPLFTDNALRLFAIWTAIPEYLAPMWPELGFRDLDACAREIDGLGYRLIVRDWQAETWSDWVRRVVTPDVTPRVPGLKSTGP